MENIIEQIIKKFLNKNGGNQSNCTCPGLRTGCGSAEARYELPVKHYTCFVGAQGGRKAWGAPASVFCACTCPCMQHCGCGAHFYIFFPRLHPNISNDPIHCQCVFCPFFLKKNPTVFSCIDFLPFSHLSGCHPEMVYTEINKLIKKFSRT